MLKTTVPECPILNETLQFLKLRYGARWKNQSIEDFNAMWAFTVVRLKSKATGLCMSYQQLGKYALPPVEVNARTNRLKQLMAEGDPILEAAILRSRPRSTFDMALAGAILSALSQRFLTREALAKDGIKCVRGPIPISRAAPEAKSVLIIGFGGYLMDACSQPHIKRVVCADLLAADPSRRAGMEAQMERMRPHLSNKEYVLTDGSDTEQRLKEADLVCITGSAVSSGTMDELLKAASHATIIVEGLSATFLPHAYFDRGVRYVVPAIVDLDLLPLTHRYGRQVFQNEIHMQFGDYVDILLPSYQTMSRS